MKSYKSIEIYFLVKIRGRLLKLLINYESKTNKSRLYQPTPEHTQGMDTTEVCGDSDKRSTLSPGLGPSGTTIDVLDPFPTTFCLETTGGSPQRSPRHTHLEALVTFI